jgi:CMP/dCMP kinase
VASGKSTVARLLAQRLGCTFLDTGALYRAVAFALLARGIAPEDDRTVASFVQTLRPKIELDAASPLGYRVRIEGRSLGDELFSPAVSRAVSATAANAAVRAHLIGPQREFAAARDVVMAGRDIGSVVLPDADFKFFLTASLDARVDRRLKELQGAGIAIERSTLRTEIEGRDQRDRTRAASPLVRASDAIEIDTSDCSVDEVVDRIEAIVVRTHPR